MTSGLKAPKDNKKEAISNKVKKNFNLSDEKHNNCLNFNI